MGKERELLARDHPLPLGSNPQRKGPKFKTCESCRTRPTVGVATQKKHGVMFFIHLCERCQPGEEGWEFREYDVRTLEDQEQEMDR